MKIKAKNCFHANKSSIGRPVTNNQDDIIGSITDVTKEYIFADVDLTEEDITGLPASFEIEIAKE